MSFLDDKPAKLFPLPHAWLYYHSSFLESELHSVCISDTAIDALYMYVSNSHSAYTLLLYIPVEKCKNEQDTDQNKDQDN